MRAASARARSTLRPSPARRGRSSSSLAAAWSARASLPLGSMRSRRRRVPIVVVPGGGALADEVRACQSQLGFGDRAAHRMALLAMDQLAWAVAGLRQGFAVGATEAELRAALERGPGGGVGALRPWSPSATDIEESWRLTSDSLALWLAGRIGAARCYLIKSIAARGDARERRRSSRATASSMRPFPAMLKETGVQPFCSAAATSRPSPPRWPRTKAQAAGRRDRLSHHSAFAAMTRSLRAG